MSDYGIRPPGYRLPDATHVGAVHLQVADLSRSLVYYEQVLGLRVLHREGQTVSFGPHGDELPLVWLNERPGVAAVPRRGLLGLFHFAILLPDRASLGRFLTHVASQSVALGSADHAVSEALYLYDPDGLGIEVYADRPRAEWQYEGRQLYMTTEPLDVRSVVFAGGGEQWTGMPVGTKMGHVHLHVGDLDQGAAFYHAALGFDKVVWDYPGALFMSAGGYHHHLGTNTWSSGPPASDADARLLAWELVVPTRSDVDAVAKSLNAARYEAARITGGVAAADPWGTAVRVLARAS